MHLSGPYVLRLLRLLRLLILELALNLINLLDQSAVLGDLATGVRIAHFTLSCIIMRRLIRTRMNADFGPVCCDCDFLETYMYYLCCAIVL